MSTKTQFVNQRRAVKEGNVVQDWIDCCGHNDFMEAMTCHDRSIEILEQRLIPENYGEFQLSAAGRESKTAGVTIESRIIKRTVTEEVVEGAGVEAAKS